MKKIAAVILSAIILFSLSLSVMAAPSGTPISSLEGLKSLNNATGKFYLANDIVLSKDSNFTPIKNFNGMLDGNGKKIVNLSIEISSANEKICVGLFENLDLSGSVKNLTIENLKIECSSETVGHVYMGGIVGENSGSSIRNCRVGGEIKVNAPKKHLYVGGIVGRSDKPIKFLESAVNIEAVASAVHGGGIVGEYLSNAQESLEQCINSGNIDVFGVESTSYGGGIVGESNWSVSNCANYGTVSVNSDGDSYSAGIAGKLKGGSIIKCFNAGKIRCQASRLLYWDAIVADGGSSEPMLWFCLENCVAGKNASEILAKSLSSTEIILQKSFEGFDFTSIWSMKDGKLTLQKITAANVTVANPPSQNESGTQGGNQGGTTSATVSDTVSTPEDEYVPPVNITSGNSDTNDNVDGTVSSSNLDDDFTPKKSLPVWLFIVIAVLAVAGVCVFLYTYKKQN